MKTLNTLFISTILLTTTAAFAETHALFLADKTIIVIQGQADTDATTLYASMNIAATDDGNTFKKEIVLNHENGNKLLELTCSQSKLIQNFASCTLTLFKSGLMQSGGSSAIFSIERNSSMAAQAQTLFKAPDSNGKIFISADHKLTIAAEKDATEKRNFYIWYR